MSNPFNDNLWRQLCRAHRGETDEPTQEDWEKLDLLQVRRTQGQLQGVEHLTSLDSFVFNDVRELDLDHLLKHIDASRIVGIDIENSDFTDFSWLQQFPNLKDVTITGCLNTHLDELLSMKNLTSSKLSGSPYDERTFRHSIAELQLRGVVNYAGSNCPVQEREWEIQRLLADHNILCGSLCAIKNFPKECRLTQPGRREDTKFLAFYHIDDVRALLVQRESWTVESFWDACEHDKTHWRPDREAKEVRHGDLTTAKAATKAFQEGDVVKAHQIIDQRLGEHLHRSYRSDLLFLKGRFLDEANEPDEALAYFDQALEADRHHYAARENAAFLAGQTDVQSGIRRFDELSKMAPTNSAALSNLGELHHKAGQLQEAYRALFRAYKTRPRGEQRRRYKAVAEEIKAQGGTPDRG